MNIKQNLFASLGRKGIIATTTGLIAVGGVCLTIDKITKQDSKKNKEETSVVKDTINKFKSYDISNDNFISVEGEGNNEQINVAILPVLEKSISVSTNVDFESSIAAGTPLDELMKEESSSLELAIIKKSKELEETKKKYEAAEEKYKSALERAKLISGDLSIDEYISKTKDELDAAKG